MEVYAWLVKVITGADELKHCKTKEVVFITEGFNLAQLQQEIEIRFVGQRMEVKEIQSLGPIGNRRA